MQIVIDIPDEQVKKSLEESKYIHEDEGEKGYVHISMLYTNAQLEFVDVERKTDFYSCEYKILPKGHGRLIDADALYDSTILCHTEENGIFIGVHDSHFKDLEDINKNLVSQFMEIKGGLDD